MAELDAFGTHWEFIDHDNVPLARVKGCDVVPMSMGTVAMLIIAKHHRASEGDADVNTQLVMVPAVARQIAAALIEAANKVSN
jgi:hypothetical protein